MSLSKCCSVCKVLLSLDKYHKSKSTKDGYSYRCKNCDYQARIKYRTERKLQYQTVTRKEYRKRVYGLSDDSFNTLWKKQKGKCPICDKTLTDALGNKHLPSKAVIDHCHKTGKIRGILCTMCNKGLGLLGDNINGLKKAVQYLNAEVH